MTRRLLVNWVTHPLVGMTVEGLRWANAFKAENPDLETGLLLDSNAPIALARCLPSLDHVYAVDVDQTCNQDRLVSEPALPKRWSYIFTDPRHHGVAAESSFRKVDDILRRCIGRVPGNRGWDRTGLPVARHRPLRLVLPEAARRRAAACLPQGRSPVISIVPGSAAEPSRTPAASFWHELICAVRDRHPDAAFVVIASLGTPNGRCTQGIDRDWVNRLVSSRDGVVDAVDLPLLEQLALAARCDVHVSPHTGMSFAIQCVGTPWLVLSGAREVEYVFNGVPWRSVYPTCDRYPCGNWLGQRGNRMYPRCRVLAGLGRPFDCLDTAALLDRLGDILDGIEDLLHGRIDYHGELQRHRAEIVRRTGLDADTKFLDGGSPIGAPDFLFPTKPRQE